MAEGLLANISVVWTAVTVVLSLAIGLQMGSIFMFKREAPKYDIPTNSFTDLYFMGVALCFISLYRNLAHWLAKPKVETRMQVIEPGCPENKIDKNTRAIVGTVWYTFTTLYGLYLFYDHPYVPTPFLGGCKCEEVISKWPRYTVTPDIKKYYMIQLAHHIHSLLELIAGAKLRNDVAEMSLHHIATVSAMLFSYFGNQIAMGITVLIAHNVGDIFINLAKFSRDLKLVKGLSADLLFVTLFVSWFGPRVILISSCVLPAGIYTRHIKEGVYDPALQPLISMMAPSDALQITMVFIIMILNVFWSYLLIKMAYNKIVGTGTFEVKGDKAH